MDADSRTTQCPGEACTDRRTHQQRAREAGAFGPGDAIEIGNREPAVGQSLTRQRNDSAHMVSRREFGHDAAVALMHVDLRMQRLPQQTPLGTVDRETGFVAGAFDAKYSHRRSIAW